MASPFKNFAIAGYHTDKNVGTAGRVIVGILLTLIVYQLVIGFFDAKKEVDDQNKVTAMTSLLSAINLYYRDSSDFLEARYYPIAACSNELNNFDYEYTLRSKLTGYQSNKATTHTYITRDTFPTDPNGGYSVTFPTTFDCASHVTPAEFTSHKYFDGSNHCKYDVNTSPNCFLYTSSLIGDSFKLSYWSPYYNKYVIYSKFRGDTMQIKLY